MGVAVSKTALYKSIEEVPYLRDFSRLYAYILKEEPAQRYITLFDSVTDLNTEDVAGWLNITPKTYRSYRKHPESALKGSLKEHMIVILSLYRHGMDVFGSRELFEKWLTTPNVLLDKKAPRQFLDTISGVRFIDNRLTALEYRELFSIYYYAISVIFKK